MRVCVCVWREREREIEREKRERERKQAFAGVCRKCVWSVYVCARAVTVLRVCCALGVHVCVRKVCAVESLSVCVCCVCVVCACVSVHLSKCVRVRCTHQCVHVSSKLLLSSSEEKRRTFFTPLSTCFLSPHVGSLRHVAETTLRRERLTPRCVATGTFREKHLVAQSVNQKTSPHAIHRDAASPKRRCVVIHAPLRSDQGSGNIVFSHAMRHDNSDVVVSETSHEDKKSQVMNNFIPAVHKFTDLLKSTRFLQL